MVVHDYYPKDARVRREARAAVRVGWRVDVICLTDEGQPKHEVIEQIAVHRVGVRRNRGVGTFRMLREYLTFAATATIIAARLHGHNRGAADRVVQVHAPPDFLIIAGILPKWLGARLILDIHDISRHLYLARFEGRRAARVVNGVLARIERCACALADHVITVHEPYRDELIANGVGGSRITVVMNSVDDDLIAGVSVANRNGRGSAHANHRRFRPAFTVAYHGAITRPYGVGLIVEALPRVLEDVPELRCVILGGGDELSAIEQRAAELGVAGAVELSGRFLPIEKALAQVARADCGLIPNRPSNLNRFALSSKLFEYVALGVPAVVARLDTLARHFGPDEVTFFDPGDARSFAEAIVWVAKNPLEAHAKAQRALARSREYSWTENRARYLGVLAPSVTSLRGLRDASRQARTLSEVRSL